MDSFLDYETDQDDDFYRIIGCDEHSNESQILVEYKVKALELHPDKNPNNPNAVEQFARLQQAKDVLSNPETRTKYDRWRSSGIPMSFQQWTSMRDTVHVSMHWRCSKKEAMIEDKQPTPADDFPDSGCKVWVSDDSNFLTKFRNYEL